MGGYNGFANRSTWNVLQYIEKHNDIQSYITEQYSDEFTDSLDYLRDHTREQHRKQLIERTADKLREYLKNADLDIAAEDKFEDVDFEEIVEINTSDYDYDDYDDCPIF